MAFARKGPDGQAWDLSWALAVAPVDLRALLRDLPTHREALGSLDPRPWQSPLLIWGEADQVFPVDSGARLAERLEGRLVVIPDTAHGPPAEAPRDFNRILIEELRRP